MRSALRALVLLQAVLGVAADAAADAGWISTLSRWRAEKPFGDAASGSSGSALASLPPVRFVGKRSHKTYQTASQHLLDETSFSAMLRDDERCPAEWALNHTWISMHSALRYCPAAVPAEGSGAYELLPSVRTVSPAHLVWVEDDGQRSEAGGREDAAAAAAGGEEVVREGGALNLTHGGAAGAWGGADDSEDTAVAGQGPAEAGALQRSTERKLAEIHERWRRRQAEAAAAPPSPAPTYFAFFLFQPGDPQSLVFSAMVDAVSFAFPHVSFFRGDGTRFGRFASEYQVRGFPRLLLFKDGRLLAKISRRQTDSACSKLGIDDVAPRECIVALTLQVASILDQWPAAVPPPARRPAEIAAGAARRARLQDLCTAAGCAAFVVLDLYLRWRNARRGRRAAARAGATPPVSEGEAKADVGAAASPPPDGAGGAQGEEKLPM